MSSAVTLIGTLCRFWAYRCAVTTISGRALSSPALSLAPRRLRRPPPRTTGRYQRLDDPASRATLGGRATHRHSGSLNFCNRREIGDRRVTMSKPGTRLIKSPILLVRLVGFFEPRERLVLIAPISIKQRQRQRPEPRISFPRWLCSRSACACRPNASSSVARVICLNQGCFPADRRGRSPSSDPRL